MQNWTLVNRYRTRRAAEDARARRRRSEPDAWYRVRRSGDEYVLEHAWKFRGSARPVSRRRRRYRSEG